MLLEYFLSSETPELSSDTKVSTKSNLILSNQLSADNLDSFKNALTDSILDRSKHLNNQGDTSCSEGNLLNNIQKWDQLYSGEVFEQNSDIEAQKYNTNNPILSEENKDVSQTSDYMDRFATGGEVPADGKQLPVNSLLSNKVIVSADKKSATSEVIVVGQQIKNDVTISTNENNELKNPETKIVVATKADTKNILNEPIAVLDKNIESSKQPKKAQMHVHDSAAKSLNISASQLKNPEQFHAKEVSSNPKANAHENIVAKTPSSEKLLRDIKPGNSEQIKSQNENIQKTASTLLNDEIKKAKATEFFPVNLKAKPLVTNEVKGRLPNLVSQSTSQGHATSPTTATIVPESLKLEQPNQIENQSPQLSVKDIKGNPLAEQFIQQVVKNETISSSLTNTDTTTQNTSRPQAAMLGAESISHQSQQAQQINSTQSINRHNEVVLPVSMPTPQWNKKFAEHVSMLALKGTTSAHIKLDPPELGPLAVKIVHTGSETQVQFQVTNPIARELVESGMNKLREMLEEHGFENVDVDVSEQQTNEQHASEDASDLNDKEDKNDELRPHSNELPEKFNNNSSVDLFA
ncbi:MAG: hypothetical protein GY829_09315 [Gammaproteobacteria bacterium]|nr:hypothetical protein [Gammaproteobacteria bacterium]